MKPAGSALALFCLVLLAGLTGCEGFGFGQTKKAVEPPQKPHFDKAIDFESQGNYDQAAAEYRKAINETPDDSRAYVNLGRLFARSGDTTAAEAYWTKATEVNPKEKRAYNLLGGSALRNYEYSKAVTYYQKALEIDPNDAAIHWNMAIAYRNMNMDRDAAKYYRSYLQLAPNGPPEDTAEAKKYLDAHGQE